MIDHTAYNTLIQSIFHPSLHLDKLSLHYDGIDQTLIHSMIDCARIGCLELVCGSKQTGPTEFVGLLTRRCWMAVEEVRVSAVLLDELVEKFIIPWSDTLLEGLQEQHRNEETAVEMNKMPSMSNLTSENLTPSIPSVRSLVIKIPGKFIGNQPEWTALWQRLSALKQRIPHLRLTLHLDFCSTALSQQTSQLSLYEQVFSPQVVSAAMPDMSLLLLMHYWLHFLGKTAAEASLQIEKIERVKPSAVHATVRREVQRLMALGLVQEVLDHRAVLLEWALKRFMEKYLTWFGKWPVLSELVFESQFPLVMDDADGNEQELGQQQGHEQREQRQGQQQEHVGILESILDALRNRLPVSVGLRKFKVIGRHSTLRDHHTRVKKSVSHSFTIH